MVDIIVITPPKDHPAEVAQIHELFALGLECLHIRKPKWTERKVEELIREIHPRYYKHIVLHGHYNLAIKYKLKGIHLHRRHRSSKWKNRFKRLLLKLRHPSMIMTTTFNSLESLRDNRQAFDYVFLSSVFNSHAYYHKDEEAGINMLRSIVSKSICPVYALGGVSTEKLPTVEVAGFKGAGLSSSVWKDFERQSKQLSNLIHAA